MGRRKKTELTEANVCELLKRKRESLGLSQKEISRLLGYKTPTMVSMMEANSAKIPLSKLSEVVSIYDLPSGFLNIMVKVLFPEFWNLAFEMRKHGFCEGSREDVETKVLELWKELNQTHKPL